MDQHYTPYFLFKTWNHLILYLIFSLDSFSTSSSRIREPFYRNVSPVVVMESIGRNDFLH